MFEIIRNKVKLTLIIASLWLAIATISSQTAQANPTILNDTEISKALESLPGWTRENQKIKQTFKFKDFVSAVDFVNRLVEPAEAAAHHPDLAISYNQVTVELTTHDAGGITQKDLELAKTISQLAE